MYIPKILTGDCREIMGKSPQPLVDLTVTSPPYNLDMGYDNHKDGISYHEYLAWSDEWLGSVYRFTRDGGRLCLNVPLDKNKGGLQATYSDLLTVARAVGWKYHSTIIWNEGNMSRRTAWGSWMSASAPYVIAPVETIMVLYKGETWKKPEKGTSDITRDEFIAWTNGLWTFNGESAKRIGHPAPFPVELPHRCIKLFSYVDDVIFDPFLGSGSTLVAAVLNNRKAIGIDISEKYVELARNRISEIRKKTEGSS